MKALLFMLAMQPVALAEPVGTWTYTNRVDPLTDEKQDYIAQRDTLKKGALLVRCRGGQPEVVLGTEEYISNTMVPTLYRFDVETAKAALLEPSADGTGVFVEASETKNFILALQKSSKFAFRVTRYNKDSRTFVFQFVKTKEALQKLSCFSSLLTE